MSEIKYKPRRSNTHVSEILHLCHNNAAGETIVDSVVIIHTRADNKANAKRVNKALQELTEGLYRSAFKQVNELAASESRNGPPA